jgi:hypothetical protein
MTKLEYACEVLGVCFEREIAKLEKVQIKSARIFHDEHNLQVEILFPLSSRCKYRKLTTFNKMHNTLCPQYLGNFLPPTV